MSETATYTPVKKQIRIALRNCGVINPENINEYISHVMDKKCPAGVCRDLLEYFILEENCVGCTACARACPVGAISGERKELHTINASICIKCGACLEKCKFDAVVLI